MLTRVDKPEMTELQTFQGSVHRSRCLRRFIEFEFYAKAASAAEKEKIDFQALIGRPEERF